METGGGRFPQREEDVAHDGGTANARGGDNVEDAVNVLTEVFLENGRAGSGLSGNTPHKHMYTHRHTYTRTRTNAHVHCRHAHSYPIGLKVL